jgi:hypothetical protein
MNVIDFAAIFPFYIELFASAGGGGLGFLRVLRLARVFRIFKLGKYNSGMTLFSRTIISSLSALYLLSFFFIIATVLFASLIYFVEGGTWHGPGAICNSDGETCEQLYKGGAYLRYTADGYAQEPSPFSSIPASFWWVIVTATTVGYGDLYPTSLWGKIIGTACMVVGLLVLALPITVIGSNFAAEYERAREEAEAQEILVAELRELNSSSPTQKGGAAEDPSAVKAGEVEAALATSNVAARGLARATSMRQPRRGSDTEGPQGVVHEVHRFENGALAQITLTFKAPPGKTKSKSNPKPAFSAGDKVRLVKL